MRMFRHLYLRRLAAKAIACAAIAFAAAPAMATPCHVSGVTAGTFNIGRYAGNAVNKNLGSLFVTVTRTGTDTTCTGRLAFYRPSSPSQMTGAFGDTLAYDVQNGASQSLVGSASWATTLPFTYSGSGTSFTVDVSQLSVVVPAGAVPTAGGYADNAIGIVAAIVNVPHGESFSALTTTSATTASRMTMISSTVIRATNPPTLPISSRAICPRVLPFRRMEQKRMTKSCTQPPSTAPRMIHSVPGKYPNCAASVGPTNGPGPAIAAK